MAGNSTKATNAPEQSKKDFDVGKLNKQFDEQKAKDFENRKLAQEKKIAELNKIEYVPIYKLTVSEILTGIKDTWFDFLDDLLQFDFTVNTFTKNDRLYYIGITLVIMCVFVYLYDFFTDELFNKDKTKDNKNNSTINIYTYDFKKQDN